jgi:amino acid transporter
VAGDGTMSERWEFVFYVSVGTGMAFATSSFTMIAGLFDIVTGPLVLVAIVLAAIVCGIISCSIGELACMYPSAPGVRTYLKAAFGNRMSLFVVYLYLIFIVLMAGAESYVFSLVMGALWPGLSPLAVVLGLLTCAVGANLAGLALPRWLEVAATGLLVTLVVGFGAYGFVAGTVTWTGAMQVPGSSELYWVPAAVAMAVFLFVGFEWITPLGLSPRSYQRRIPLSMPVAIAVALVAYSSFAVGLGSQLPRESIVSSLIPQAPYLARLIGDSGLYWAGVISALATFSTFNAGVMGSARLIYALAREGNLPQPLARISLETGAPVGAVLLLGVLSGLSAFVVITGDLALAAAVVGSAIVCCVYTAYMLAVIRLRRLQPGWRRTYRTRIHPSVQWSVVVFMPLMALQSLFAQQGKPYQPALGMVACVIAATGLTWMSVLLAARQHEGYRVPL